MYTQRWHTGSRDVLHTIGPNRSFQVAIAKRGHVDDVSSTSVHGGNCPVETGRTEYSHGCIIWILIVAKCLNFAMPSIKISYYLITSLSPLGSNFCLWDVSLWTLSHGVMVQVHYLPQTCCDEEALDMITWWRWVFRWAARHRKPAFCPPIVALSLNNEQTIRYQVWTTRIPVRHPGSIYVCVVKIVSVRNSWEPIILHVNISYPRSCQLVSLAS